MGTTNEHKKKANTEINFGVITLSDSRKKEDEDISGNYISNLIEEKYTLKEREIIRDEKHSLQSIIKKYIDEKIDVIITTGGTGLDERDITIETVESLFDKKLDGFGEIFRMKSYEEIGISAILSRATAGIYNKTLIFCLPGSPGAVKTGMNMIIDEFPHLVYHAKK